MINMTLQSLIQKLNWRQILLHFVATWFFLFAFQQFAFLTSPTKFDASRMFVKTNTDEAVKYLHDKGFSAAEIIRYFFYAKAAWIAGLIIAFIISLTIAKTKGWFWINSLVVFLTVFLLAGQDLLGWTYLKNIFLMPGRIFTDTLFYLLTNGLVLLCLGVFVFSFSKFNNFIDNHNLTINNH
jgi:hypothetical protein